MGERIIIDSMQNHVQQHPPYAWAALAPLSLHTKIAREAKYNGIEYYPLQATSIQLRLVKGIDTSEVFSSHESWGNGKIPFVLVMRKNIPSLKDSIILQSKSNHPESFLTVVYPNEASRDETWPQEFNKLNNKIIQPTIDLMKEWGVDNINDFLIKAKSMGFRICLDLFHIRRGSVKNGSTMENWKKIIDVLINYTDELHLGVGREDFKGPFDSMEELVDLYTGSTNTEIVPILEYIKAKEKEMGKELPIVTEIYAHTIIKMLDKQNTIATPSLLIKTHKRIVENLRSLMEKPVTP